MSYDKLRGLYYCQPQIGVGPFTRAIYLCKSLVESFSVDLLMGFPVPPFDFHSPRLHLHALPPLWLVEIDKQFSLRDPLHAKQRSEVFKERWKALRPVLVKPFSFIITEAFPFSKWEMQDEILSMLQLIKLNNPRCLVVCTLLDIPTLQEKMNTKVINTLDKYYDLILFHADPRYHRLEKRFSLIGDLSHKLVYTGFVTNPDPLDLKIRRTNQILVSIGGGYYGNELFLHVLKAAQLLSNFSFKFAIGPRTSEAFIDELKRIKSENAISNAHFVNFLTNIEEEMQKSLLSISLGGHGTLFASIKTKTPALIYTQAHWEHAMRIAPLAENEVLRIIKNEELDSLNLCKIILETIPKEYPSIDINLDGSYNSYLEIKKRIQP